MSDEKEINLGRFVFEIDDLNKVLGYGVSQIYSERDKQIEKHGFTAEYQALNPNFYAVKHVAGDFYQLQDAAMKLLGIDINGFDPDMTPVPSNWNREWFIRLCEKPQEDRLRIAAALLAAELDRLEYLRNN